MSQQKPKWTRRKAKLKASQIQNIETRPWRCPTCSLRFAKRSSLASHVRVHPINNTVPIDIGPTAGEGKILPPKKSTKVKVTTKKALRDGRQKGQKSQTRLQLTATNIWHGFWDVNFVFIWEISIISLEMGWLLILEFPWTFWLLSRNFDALFTLISCQIFAGVNCTWS